MQRKENYTSYCSLSAEARGVNGQKGRIPFQQHSNVLTPSNQKTNLLMSVCARHICPERRQLQVSGLQHVPVPAAGGPGSVSIVPGGHGDSLPEGHFSIRLRVFDRLLQRHHSGTRQKEALTDPLAVSFALWQFHLHSARCHPLAADVACLA